VRFILQVHKGKTLQFWTEDWISILVGTREPTAIKEKTGLIGLLLFPRMTTWFSFCADFFF
jgi:hypothetical protein